MTLTTEYKAAGGEEPLLPTSCSRYLFMCAFALCSLCTRRVCLSPAASPAAGSYSVFHLHTTQNRAYLCTPHDPYSSLLFVNICAYIPPRPHPTRTVDASSRNRKSSRPSQPEPYECPCPPGDTKQIQHSKLLTYFSPSSSNNVPGLISLTSQGRQVQPAPATLVLHAGNGCPSTPQAAPQ